MAFYANTTDRIACLGKALLYGSAYPFMLMEEPLEETLKFPISRQAMENICGVMAHGC